MNTILGFKNLEDEEIEEHPCSAKLRGTMTTFHESIMNVMSISSLEEEDEEEEVVEDTKPSVMSVIAKVKQRRVP